MSQTDEHPTAPESTDDDTFVVVKKETTGSRDRFNEATYIDGFTRETALVNACKSGDLPRVRALLRQGISIHSIDVNSHTPLIGSVYRNHLNVTKYLLALNANPNQPEHYSGGTALHKAASYGNAPALALLLAAGADVTARERPPSRATPLHLAVKGGHVACVRALLAAGAVPRIKDEAKRTAVSLAEEAVAASAKDSDSSGSDDDDDDDEFGDVGSSSASVASAAAEGTAVTEGAAADSSDPSGIDGASKDVSKDSSKAAAKKKKKGSGKGRRKRAAAAILAALQSAASALDAEEGISTDAAAAAAAVAAEAEAEGALMPPPEKKEQSAVQAFLACFR